MKAMVFMMVVFFGCRLVFDCVEDFSPAFEGLFEAA